MMTEYLLGLVSLPGIAAVDAACLVLVNLNQQSLVWPPKKFLFLVEHQMLEFSLWPCKPKLRQAASPDTTHLS